MKALPIANVLSKHRDEIFTLMNNGDQKGLVAKVNELLDSEELKGNASLAHAKSILRSKEKQPTIYRSTVMTYMTCMKAK